MSDPAHRDLDNPDRDKNEQTNKAEIHNDDVKERHTSHWDTDFMTTEQLEAAYREGKERQQDANEDEDPSDE